MRVCDIRCKWCGHWPTNLESGHLVSHPSAHTDTKNLRKKEMCVVDVKLSFHFMFFVTECVYYKYTARIDTCLYVCIYI